MKRFIIILTAIFSLLFLLIRAMPAQSQTTSPIDNHTASEEAEGKVIWEKLQAKQIECKDLTDENYGSLGEYYMGQMMGNSHAAMNTMMERMMGKEGEEQMHIAMGKRLSGCEPNAQVPSSGVGFMPMMGSGWGNMMGGWGSAGWRIGIFGWLSMILFWLLLILGAIALIRYLGGSGKRSDEGKPPVDILKERYARGEISKKEFEEMKKDLS